MSALLRLFKHPSRLWIPLVWHRIHTVTHRKLEAWRASKRSTFAVRSNVRLSALLALPPADLVAATNPWLPHVSQLFLEHRFDWLGLGWCSVGYESVPPGLAGHRYTPPSIAPDRSGDWLRTKTSPFNLAECQQLWRQLDGNYRPIDWQRDHLSGYRWNMEDLASVQPIYPVLGADIKQPWELARLQHLPLLALAFSCAIEQKAGFKLPDCYLNEFRNTTLDFLATNPPGYGVNWVCSMDVAIRIVNLLVAADLFRAGGAVFSTEFENLLARTASEHACHIRAHLERRPDFRANHYLANLAGLLFVGAYLGPRAQGAIWWNFARDEMCSEVRRQFLRDGANFEASTGYHRLSGEIAAWSLALMAGIEGSSILDSELQARLAGMGKFIRDTSRPDGSAPAIGDLDNGRLLKLSSTFQLLSANQAATRYAGLADAELKFPEGYWMERLDRHLHLADAIDCFFVRKIDITTAETFLLAHLMGKAAGALPNTVSRPTETESNSWPAASAALKTYGTPQQSYRWDLPGEDQPCLSSYPDFGLYIVRASRWLLTIRCGPNGQEGNGGHAHNDQLSLTLQIDGISLIEDPGMPIYHALPELRNAYRSVRSHFSPRPDTGEPAGLDLDPFRLPRHGEGHCLFFGNNGFIGFHEGYGTRIFRTVRWTENALQIEDYANGLLLVNLMQGSARHWRSPLPPCMSYGRSQLY